MTPQEYIEYLGRLQLIAARGVVRVPNKRWDIKVSEKEAVILRMLPVGFRDMTALDVVKSAKDRGVVLEKREATSLLNLLHRKLGDDVVRKPFFGHFMLVPKEVTDP